jgi:hypothetical protein
MPNETNKQHRCNHLHPSYREWMMASSVPATATFLEPLTGLDEDFLRDWDAEDVAKMMAYFAFDTLRALHAGDSKFDKGMAFDRCMSAARRTVFDYAWCSVGTYREGLTSFEPVLSRVEQSTVNFTDNG